MKTSKLKFLIVPVALFVITSCGPAVPSNDIASNDIASNVSADTSISTSVDVSTSGSSSNPSVSNDSGNYYNSLSATNGNELLGQLHDLITSTHNRYLSYNDCKYSSNLVKSDPYINNGVIDKTGLNEFYSQAKWAVEDANATSATHLNREHVWPQSISNGLWGTAGGGADLHHLRPAEYKINGQRGNKLYGNIGSNRDSYKAYANGSSQNYLAGYCSSIFEPLDNVKGDVARIIMYLYVHYNSYSNVYGKTNGSGSSEYFGSLSLTGVISASSEANARALLIKWSNDDPVDIRESTRNNAVYALQGNRNPFIDHPEYMSAIFAA